jgi:hypothetical protein
MFAILELYLLFGLVILSYVAFPVSKKDKLLALFAVIFLLMIVVYFFITKTEDTKLQLDSNQTYVKKIYTGFTNNVKVYVRPLSGECTVDLLYGYDKTDQKVSQCRWISKSDDVQTNTFINDALGSYYELRVTPTTKTNVIIAIVKGNNMNVYQTPYNSIIAPLNVSTSRVVEIAPEGSSYSENQKSAVFDFGSSNAANIEIYAICSNATNPKLNLFGSDINEESKFVRITEISFTDGGFSNSNSKFYIDNVLLTHHRYYYIQIINAEATNLYVKIIRRNY